MSNDEMISTMRADADVATLPRRALSTIVDGVIGLVVFGGGAATVAWRTGWPDATAIERVMKPLAWPMRLTTVATRNWRSPGRRVAGVRRVDARTSGPVTVRSAVVDQLLSEGCSRLLRPRVQRVTAAGRPGREAADRQIEEVRRLHAGDLGTVVIREPRR